MNASGMLSSLWNTFDRVDIHLKLKNDNSDSRCTQRLHRIGIHFVSAKWCYPMRVSHYLIKHRIWACQWQTFHLRNMTITVLSDSVTCSTCRFLGLGSFRSLISISPAAYCVNDQSEGEPIWESVSKRSGSAMASKQIGFGLEEEDGKKALAWWRHVALVVKGFLISWEFQVKTSHQSTTMELAGLINARI